MAKPDSEALISTTDTGLLCLLMVGALQFSILICKIMVHPRDLTSWDSFQMQCREISAVLISQSQSIYNPPPQCTDKIWSQRLNPAGVAHINGFPWPWPQYCDVRQRQCCLKLDQLKPWKIWLRLLWVWMDRKLKLAERQPLKLGKAGCAKPLRVRFYKG